MKKITLLLIIFITTAIAADAQFPIKIPKIKVPKIEQPETQSTPQPANIPMQPNQTNNSVANNTNPQFSQTRQMVMDDGYAFFGAEPVEEYDSKVSLNKDVGWYLESRLRLMGTFPKRSAFRIAVVKNGKQLSIVRCEPYKVYKKSEDSGLTRPRDREGRDLSFEDFMHVDFKCLDKTAVNKEIGKVNIQVYFIDGDTDAETLVRTYQVDVHKATKVRGAASNPQPDVADYYIQRHAEAAIAFAFFGNYQSDKPVATGANIPVRKLTIYTTYSPNEKSFNVSGSFARCSVNGRRINLDYDAVGMSEGGDRQEIGIYLDRLTPQYKRGSPYKDHIEFMELKFAMPLYIEKSQYDQPREMNILDHPGKWECSVIAKGETYRIFRWEVANGKIVKHPEQQNGNINLYYDAAMIDMEIPTGGSPIDFRLMPMPEMGLFYGIPWTTAEGKAKAARVPKVGNPYPVPSTKAN
ncbi:MAG: hypothetical protein KIS76_07145 [Pyrinomonadaceae bacterium]|nr:hypothetical protein [Pyrinomonadaceae bacterium]